MYCQSKKCQWVQSRVSVRAVRLLAIFKPKLGYRNNSIEWSSWFWTSNSTRRSKERHFLEMFTYKPCWWTAKNWESYASRFDRGRRVNITKITFLIQNKLLKNHAYVGLTFRPDPNTNPWSRSRTFIFGGLKVLRLSDARFWAGFQTTYVCKKFENYGYETPVV